MKRVRILTGHHVGSTLDLIPGTHLIGTSHDCDIAITDWTCEPMRLHVGEAGVSGRFEDTAGDASRLADHVFEDFKPRRFDDIVLCFGPTGAEWPADVELLDRVFQPQPAAVPQGRPLVTAAWIGAAVLSFGAIAWTSTLSGAPLTMEASSLPAAQASLQQALRKVNAGTLEVRIDGRALVVSGIVETGEQARQVQAVLAELRGKHHLMQRLGVATDIAEAIRSSVGLPEAVIRHTGHGVFSFSAEATDPKAARAALERVQFDLSSVVTRIDATLEQRPLQDDTPLLSRMTSDGLSVVQTRDGVKHLVVRAAQDTPVSVREILALPSPRSIPPPSGTDAVASKDIKE